MWWKRLQLKRGRGRAGGRSVGARGEVRIQANREQRWLRVARVFASTATAAATATTATATTATAVATATAPGCDCNG